MTKKNKKKEEKLYMVHDDRSPLTREEREAIVKYYEDHPIEFGPEYDIENFKKA